MQTYTRTRRWILTCIALLLLGFCTVSWLVGSLSIAPAKQVIDNPPNDLPVETIAIANESGATVAAWFIPAEGATATVVLAHSLRGNRWSMIERARLLHDAGYSTVLFDLQAHGESSGENISFGYRERLSVAAAVEFARSRDPDHKIGVIGSSLGGAAALLASPLGIDALVLEAVFPTIAEAIHNRIATRLGPLSHILTPVLLVQLRPRLGISASDLRPIDRIASVGCPVLVAAGDRDLHTTLAETQRLFAAAREPKQLVIFENAAHVSLLGHDPKKYRTQVVSFLDTYLRSPQQTGLGDVEPAPTERNGAAIAGLAMFALFASYRAFVHFFST